jgi:hypothetical protein
VLTVVTDSYSVVRTSLCQLSLSTSPNRPTCVRHGMILSDGIEGEGDRRRGKSRVGV